MDVPGGRCCAIFWTTASNLHRNSKIEVTARQQADGNCPRLWREQEELPRCVQSFYKTRVKRIRAAAVWAGDPKQIKERHGIGPTMTRAPGEATSEALAAAAGSEERKYRLMNCVL